MFTSNSAAFCTQTWNFEFSNSGTVEVRMNVEWGQRAKSAIELDSSFFAQQQLIQQSENSEPGILSLMLVLQDGGAIFDDLVSVYV